MCTNFSGAWPNPSMLLEEVEPLQLINTKRLKWGSAWHWTQEHLQRAKLPHTNAEQPWPPANWAWRVGQARIRSGKTTQNNLLHLLWTWQWSPDIPSLEFPSQFRPNFARHAKSGFGALGWLVHRKAKEMWLWCQKPQKCSLKWLFFNCEELGRMSVLSAQTPGSI